jgi:hypothetical protein
VFFKSGSSISRLATSVPISLRRALRRGRGRRVSGSSPSGASWPPGLLIRTVLPTAEREKRAVVDVSSAISISCSFRKKAIACGTCRNPGEKLSIAGTADDDAGVPVTGQQHAQPPGLQVERVRVRKAREGVPADDDDCRADHVRNGAQIARLWRRLCQCL